MVSLPKELLRVYIAWMATALMEVDEKVAAALRAQAEALHLPLSEFLREMASPKVLSAEPNRLSDAEFEALLDSAASDDPVLPKDFSRG